MSKKQAEGLKQVGTVVARQNPLVAKILDTKELSEGIYKIVKGKNPPMPKHLLSWQENLDREFARRERQLDKRFGR